MLPVRCYLWRRIDFLYAQIAEIRAGVVPPPETNFGNRIVVEDGRVLWLHVSSALHCAGLVYDPEHSMRACRRPFGQSWVHFIHLRGPWYWYEGT